MTSPASIERIAISTGGGDAPGLNAVIRAATRAAHRQGWEVVGIRDGFNGIMSPDEYPEGGTIVLTEHAVRGIGHLGGTILGTTNRGNPTKFPVVASDGSITHVDRSEELLHRLEELGVQALISVGGDGSLAIAHHLCEVASQTGHEIQIIGVPKTIDNDLDKTTSTFGFDTAVSFASESIDRLFTTAESHGRIMVVEVMGRYAGWIAVSAGIASGAHAILIPEIPYDLEFVAQTIRTRDAIGAKYSVVVVAEGAAPIGGEMTVLEKVEGGAERLGGVGEKVAEELGRLTGKETRTVVLGHLLRGGSPTAFDRLLGLRFGAAAIRAIEEGHTGIMVALAPPTVEYVPLIEATHRQKLVPLDSDTMLTGRDLGICFGDQLP
jgi:ATP-dependent phosphofructokinase / diphosphate-dependent phosphofructokinase